MNHASWFPIAHIPDLYPGSTTDNKITLSTGALDHVNVHDVGDGVLVDKDFAISKQAAVKGAIVNRPPMASCNQFIPGVDLTSSPA